MRFFLLFVFLYSLLQAREVNRHNDFQLWLSDRNFIQLNKHSKISLETELRYGANASILYFYYLQTRYFLEICKWLEIATGYRQIFILDQSNRKWNPVYNPLIDFSLNFIIRKWEIDERNRLQYLVFKHQPNDWQYRNRLQIIFPWKLGKIGMSPIISDEVFFRGRRGFFDNRFIIGGIFPLRKKIDASVLYMLRSQKSLEEEWRNHHVCWLDFNLTF